MTSVHHMKSHILIPKLLALLASTFPARAAEPPMPALPAPTHAEVPYGPHERNVLDFWEAQPKSGHPAPLAVFFHGGGYIVGSKEGLPADSLKALLDAGISVAAINYRYLQQAKLPAAHQDAVRAVQFLRSKAGEWKLDKTRVGGFGGSAGAQLVMYLAFHDDLADPKSADPVARESTRLSCVAPDSGQASLDLNWCDRHIPSFTTRSILRTSLAGRWNESWLGVSDETKAAKIIADISAISLLSKDDPPVFLAYIMAPGSPLPAAPADADNWITHSVAHGVELKKRCDELGVEAHLNYPGVETRYRSAVEFLTAKLTEGAPVKPDGK